MQDKTSLIEQGYIMANVYQKKVGQHTAFEKDK